MNKKNTAQEMWYSAFSRVTSAFSRVTEGKGRKSAYLCCSLNFYCHAFARSWPPLLWTAIFKAVKCSCCLLALLLLSMLAYVDIVFYFIFAPDSSCRADCGLQNALSQWYSLILSCQHCPQNSVECNTGERFPAFSYCAPLNILKFV